MYMCVLSHVSLKTTIREYGAEVIILFVGIFWKLEASDPGLVNQSPPKLGFTPLCPFPRDSSPASPGLVGLGPPASAWKQGKLA